MDADLGQIVKTPRIIVFAGSTRAGSVNARLAGCAAKELSLIDCEVTMINLRDYPLPIYDGDLENRDGVPENAQKLARLFDGHDGFFIACRGIQWLNAAIVEKHPRLGFSPQRCGWQGCQPPIAARWR